MVLPPPYTRTQPRAQPTSLPSLPSPPIMDDSKNVYSSPLDLNIGIKQMKAATLERKKSSATNDPSAYKPILSPDPPESDYALVNDDITRGTSRQPPLKMFNTLERQRRVLRSPDMSPPPLPFSPSPTDTEISVLNGGSDDESSNLYDSIQTAKRTPTPKGGAGYDHLEKSPEPVRRKLSKPRYDHLNPPPVPPRGDSLVGPTHQLPKLPPTPPLQQPTIPENTYATVDSTTKTHKSPTHNHHKSADRTLEDSGADNMYATVDLMAKTHRAYTSHSPPTHRAHAPHTPPTHNRHKSADTTVGDSGADNMYATVDLMAKTRRAHVPHTPPTHRAHAPHTPPTHRAHAPHTPPTHNHHKSADTTLENTGALYSSVNKRRPPTRPKPPPRRAATPDEPVYTLPDKRVKGRQSPGTPPTGMRTPPPVAPKPRRSPTPTSTGG